LGGRKKLDTTLGLLQL
jgi:transposase-like protein